MASQHTPADDIVYDLVTIQYHALTAAQAVDKYLKDAERAVKAHQLLGSLTSGSAGLSPSQG